MNARIVAPARGVRWVLEGARMFAGAPLGWMLLAFGYLILTLLMTRVPLIGTALGLLLYPGFTVGFMIAGRASALHQRLEMQMLFAGFQERAQGQLVLGAVYLAGVSLAILGSSLVDDGVLLRAFLGQAPSAEDGAEASRAGVLAALVLTLPTAMAVFFAPLLVAWHGMAPVKAAFFSFFACLLNWRAFALYLAFGVVLMILISNLVLGLALALAGPQGSDPAALLSVLFMTMMLVALPVMMSSFYACYRDLFGTPGSA
ncbi:MAG TPA: BPSS1780 family membrane protein [Burkholderiales bacterium]|nr:BPSS1780 family membrane protein [Burkholderiales bacterium]